MPLPYVSTEFILRHDNDPDPLRLLLTKGAAREAGDLEIAVNTLLGRRKARTKLPLWYSHPGIIYPTSLCIEQCSSQATASYKAKVVKRILGDDITGSTVADLTGGLGVDSAAFASVPGIMKVVYNEMNPILHDGAGHNFSILGIDSKIERHCIEVSTDDSLDEILGQERPSLIFMDPGRRSEDGRKVFMLSDCHPDVTALAAPLLQRSRHLLLKLSPMADITMVCSQLPSVREVYCVQSGGECKELLLHLDREWDGGGYDTVCTVLSETEEPFEWRFPSARDTHADMTLPRREEGIKEGMTLFECGKALSKCGVFRRLCGEFSLVKLAPDTHLYLTTGDSPLAVLSRLGKVGTIVEALPFSKSAARTTGRNYPDAGVSARNFPLRSEELSSRLGIKSASGDRYHIYGVTIQWKEGGGGEKMLLVTSAPSS